jgi:hypothetical protein
MTYLDILLLGLAAPAIVAWTNWRDAKRWRAARSINAPIPAPHQERVANA